MPSKVDIDWKFYLIAFAILGVITGWWWYSKRQIEIHQGRDVQELVDIANLDSDEAYQNNARNWVNNLAKSRPMTDDQKEEAREIYEQAFRERNKIWMDGRFAGESEKETRRKQSISWETYNQRFEEMMAETN